MATLTNEVVKTIRAAAVVTTSYVASDTFTLSPGQHSFVLELALTKESITSFEWQLQASNDGGTTFITPTEKALSAGVSTITKASETIAAASLDATDKIAVMFNRLPYPVYRFQFKGTGTVTSTSLGAVVRISAAKAP